MPSISKKLTTHEAPAPLCCCEYVDSSGEKSHVIGACCNCEDLDAVCDNILCCACGNIEQRRVENALKTFDDRCRMPWCGGKGAIQIRNDIVLPLISLVCMLLIASLGPYWTFTAFILFAGFLWLQWRVLRFRVHSKFFFSMTVFSLSLLLLEFQTIVIAFREILLWENILFGMLAGASIYCLVLTKQSVGEIKKKILSQRHKPSYQGVSDSKILLQFEQSRLGLNNQAIQPGLSSPSPHRVSEVFQSGNVGDNAPDLLSSTSDERSSGTGNMLIGAIHADSVTWLDSRPVANGMLEQWCDECQVRRTPRSGHCPVCQSCVKLRDHHCVWLDCCIGSDNHRSFFIGLSLAVLTGLYGSNLVATTICTPEMYFDWFLLPNDCNFAYSDFPSALAFVSAVYSLLATVGLAVMWFQQFLLISQNLTGQEAAVARRSKRSFAAIFVSKRLNVNNKGFFSNWYDFILQRRSQLYGTLA